MEKYIRVTGIDAHSAVDNMLELLNTGKWEYLTQCVDRDGDPIFILRNKPAEVDPDAIADKQAAADARMADPFNAGSRL